MSSDKSITAEVKLDKKTFRRFAFFDAFVLKKRWIRPAVFCGIMTVSAVAALLIAKEQSWLIAGVLLAVGVGLPAVYVISFLDQVNMQAKKNGLSAKRSTYTVIIDNGGVTVHNHRKEGEKLHLTWNDISGAYRRRDCIYLYAGMNRAFLLPDGQADISGSELWEYISARHSDNSRS
ncbi:MAG: YcxB family protein [Ruminiclostridium sp.]|nr:YcxB family protein [Ruminiclostridium sp.]